LTLCILTFEFYFIEHNRSVGQQLEIVAAALWAGWLVQIEPERLIAFSAPGLYRFLLYQEFHTFAIGSFADGLEGKTKGVGIEAIEDATAYFSGQRPGFLYFGLVGDCLENGLCDHSFVHQQILGSSLP